MKPMIFATLMATAMAMTACSSDNETVETKDWSTTTYFASTDAQEQETYYKPSVGYVGDPMPFYDPKAGDFKILYLQEFRPNQAGTYHPSGDCPQPTVPAIHRLANSSPAADFRNRMLR